MDLWDVVKLLARRWMVSVPLLLLTAVALVWTASAVSPNYTAQGNILMLPPTTEVGSSDGEERAVNPWDTDSLTGAVITLLRNQGLHDQLAAEGYAASWEAERDVQFWSVINIEVTAETTGQAQATIQRLAQVVAQEVSNRQQGYELTDGQLVGTVTLGAGENVAIARGNQMRALIVVFFAGLIATVGLTIGSDAVLRARAARSDGPYPVAARAAADRAAAAEARRNGVRITPATLPVSADEDTHAYQDRPAGISVSYRPPAGARDAPSGEERSSHAEPPAREFDDSTVVLPLSNLGSGAERGDDPAGGGGAPEHRWR